MWRYVDVSQFPNVKNSCETKKNVNLKVKQLVLCNLQQQQQQQQTQVAICDTCRNCHQCERWRRRHEDRDTWRHRADAYRGHRSGRRPRYFERQENHVSVAGAAASSSGPIASPTTSNNSGNNNNRATKPSGVEWEIRPCRIHIHNNFSIQQTSNHFFFINDKKKIKYINVFFFTDDDLQKRIFYSCLI